MTNEEKELMYLSAKAIGVELHESDDGTMQRRPIWCVTNYVMGQPYGESRWNPLGYDVQAFRIAIVLKMHIHAPMETDAVTVMSNDKKIGWTQSIEGDAFKATRYAIVKLAAQIQKEKDE